MVKNYGYLRTEVRERMVCWGVAKQVHKDAADRLMELFDCTNYVDLQTLHDNSSEVDRTMELLNGPHGFAVYKALLARKARP